VRTHVTRLRAALVLLLVGSGSLFAIGSTIERNQHAIDQPATAAASGESGHATEAGGESEQSGRSEGESSSAESTTHVEKSHSESGANILGVDTESLALTVVAVVASLLLGIAVWLRRWQRLTLLCAAGFGLVFAAGDGRELVHQLDESSAGLAAIAGVLIGLHLALTALAAALYPRQDTPASVAVAEPPV
jgi:hypothetical protein